MTALAGLDNNMKSRKVMTSTRAFPVFAGVLYYKGVGNALGRLFLLDNEKRETNIPSLWLLDCPHARGGRPCGNQRLSCLLWIVLCGSK